MRAGLRRIENLAARVALGRALLSDRRLIALPCPERTAESAGRPPGLVDDGGRVQRNLETDEVVGQAGGFTGERLRCRVPRQISAGELLAHDIAVVALVFGGDTQRSGGAAEFVPRDVDRAADRPRPGVGGPEDGRLVAGGERADPAVTPDEAGHLIDVRESEIAVGGTAQRLVLVEDLAVNQMCAGVGAEEDLSLGEFLTEAGTDLVNVALHAADSRIGAARGLPGLVDGVSGVALW